MQDDIEPDVIRSPQAVARRAVVLFSIIGLAAGAPKSEVTEWLRKEGLATELAPSEQRFVAAPHPSGNDVILTSWLSERLVVLCWALGLLERLPEPGEQSDNSVLQGILPPFAETEVSDFITSAKLRADRELVAMADTILHLHGAARCAKLNGTPPHVPVDIEIIQERHLAINWVIGYDSAEWDEVTADT